MTTERTNPRVLVLGGGYAGVLAARSVAQYAHEAARVTLISGNDHFVERIRLHQAAAGQTIARRPITGLLRGTDAHFVRGWVIGLDPERRTVTVETADRTREMPYDYLIYALGSAIDTETVPGVREHAWALDGATAGTVLAGALREVASGGGRLLVCGGGLTGIEAATEIAEAHPRLRVTLVTRDTLGAALSERGRAYLKAAFARRGIEVRERTLVTRVDPGEVQVDGQPAIPFDLCLWAGSFRVPSLARRPAWPPTSPARW